ncbi:MAG TPA: DUF1775 domain-containing protein [Ilumatobacter sp.]|nr:DUF1775 domain-containing protein [Ilumatobacter sp.]
MAVLIAGVVVGAGQVSAHIDPEPPEAPAGATLAVGFTVGHGCDDSPTVQLDMRLPDGVTSPTPVPPEGWEGSIDANVVTFTGGPLPSDTPATFRVELTLPATPGATLYFPFVQRCEEGELRWIDTPDDGSGSDLDQPAPAMTLTDAIVTPPAPTAPTDTVPAVVSTLEPTAPTTLPTTTLAPTTVAPTTAPTTDPPTTTPSSADLPVLSLTPVETGDGGGTSTGTVVFIMTMVAVALVAIIVVAQARRKR